MREFDLDDDFWPDALAALASDAPESRLRVRWPDYAELVDELVADAAREPLLVGVRLATHGRNPRLLALLTAAFLARSGVPTLILDLSPHAQWLEQLLGGDFKEGLIDHIRFGVPLERCLRPTAFEGLSAMSGGAWFLAGSPLDDAPLFRAAVDRLRQEQAVVVTLPPPLEAGDRTGIASLCGALITVEERYSEVPLAGSERAVVRLVGDPEAARDLALLGHRFLGPLPLVLAGLARVRPAEDAKALLERPANAGPDAEELDFLRSFERPTVAVDLAPEERTDREPRGRRAIVATALALVAVVAIVVSARGVASDVVGWIFGPGESDRGYDTAVAGETIALEPPVAAPAPLPADTAVALVADSAAAEAGDSTAVVPAEPLAGDSTAAPLNRGRPASYSVHVGSYQSTESAMRVVDRVRGMGYVATVAPVSLPGKGEWFRVFVGAFADSSSARRMRDRLESSAVVEEALVRSTPWTFEIGTYPTLEAARADIEALRREGIVAYPLGEGPVRLYAGAYQTRAEAEPLARALEAALGGRTATLTLREE